MLRNKKEIFEAMNGLGCFVQALTEHHVIIDLQNESSVTGLIKEVDGYMNITLENVHLDHYDGSTHKYESMYVKGRNIRFIHVPKHLNVRETIVQFLKKRNTASISQPSTALQRFKQKKRLEKQRETRERIEEMKGKKNLDVK